MISVEQLNVEFGTRPLFHDVSYVINDHDRIALVGKNGAGKSTMLKIICGIQKPTSGTIGIPNECEIGYLPQVMKLSDDTTVIEETRKAGHEANHKTFMGIDDATVQWHHENAMSSTVKAIMEEAKKYVGVPYQFGGTTPRGFDCSGFIQYVFNRKGIVLPRGADEQYSAGRKVSVNALKPGDLVYFQTYAEGISHSGLYLGDGYFISATSSQGVAVATMKSGYWHDRYMGAVIGGHFPYI